MTDRWMAPRTGIYRVTHGALLVDVDGLPETTTALPADAWVTTPAVEVA